MINENKEILKMHCKSDLKELKTHFKDVTDEAKKEVVLSNIEGVRARIERIK